MPRSPVRRYTSISEQSSEESGINTNKKCDLLLVPTAEAVGTEALPGQNGRTRLSHAAELLKDDKDLELAIIGYSRPGKISGAKGYVDYFKNTYPDLKNTIAFWDASARCSSRDMWKARFKFDNFFGISNPVERQNYTIGIVSYGAHTRRVARTLRALGYKAESFPTSEKPHYHDRIERLLDIATELDPFWFWLGIPLTYIASKRLP